ncbi:TRM11 family SAM-dependent methyltransferase [Candidatus Magnetominusculus xianensis]|uniref:Methyltransferase n=1 Tax=Candidatus Magnetominusculus xianensis TaxID=1748249 RepID=A0ABR5SCT1_9BACT|nr:class I SAM-dependent methyltransferase [Candidatus Magnetominusculus xianensis]KWT78209.1 DNA methylase N-4 [Candidatus Magnetominusculus xianensis]
MAQINLELEKSIIADKKKGLSDKDIGAKFGVTLRAIEKIITKEFGINISSPAALASVTGNRQKTVPAANRIKTLAPKDFEMEKTTVWSFKSRGTWATHNGNYRGNWSPYIPRNVILRYSKDKDLVLDYFCGAGTTGVECKLLSRNFTGIDINPHAIGLANENINFEFHASTTGTNVDFMVGDARTLDNIGNNSIDLICAHPPYADIVQYTHNNEGDLSNCTAEKFLIEIGKTARESYRVLKSHGCCAILIGDMRKNKNVIPLGFRTIERFLNEGFELKDLVIKRQHNCKTTGFWYTNSIKYNFLLLAHEYLAIFKKKEAGHAPTENADQPILTIDKIMDETIPMESTTVWIFNEKNWMAQTLYNLIKRYSSTDKYALFNNNESSALNKNLAIDLTGNNIKKSLVFAKNALSSGGIFAIMCEDIRREDGFIIPTAIHIERLLRAEKGFHIKEIVVVSIENANRTNNKEDLDITHKYILIYKKAD